MSERTSCDGSRPGAIFWLVVMMTVRRRRMRPWLLQEFVYYQMVCLGNLTACGHWAFQHLAITAQRPGFRSSLVDSPKLGTCTKIPISGSVEIMVDGSKWLPFTYGCCDQTDIETLSRLWMQWHSAVVGWPPKTHDMRSNRSRRPPTNRCRRISANCHGCGWLKRSKSEPIANGHITWWFNRIQA